MAVTRRPEAAAELKAAGVAVAPNLASAGASACVVASETARHAADAEAAFALGLDVLVEKPLAPDAAQGRRLADSAKRQGRRAYVACVMRFSPSLALLKERLPELGALHAVRAECRSYLPDWRPGRDYKAGYSADAAQGGVLRDLVHEVDYCGWLFGFPAQATGSAANLGRLGIQAEEAAEILWNLPGGGTLSIGLDYLTRRARRGLVADGERGTLSWNAMTGTVTLTPLSGPARSDSRAEDVDARFLAQATAFLGELDGRRDERLASFEDGVKALNVLDAARKGLA